MDQYDRLFTTMIDWITQLLDSWDAFGSPG